jgi:CheY-like chemotaxis protein
MRRIHAKILCVNDEADPLDLFDFIITQGGHQTLRALGAPEAHRIISQVKTLDLAIINMLMPMAQWPEPLQADWETNFQAGFIVAQFLRSKFKDIPIILDSASSAYCPVNLDRIALLPNTCFLKTPFHVHDLLHKIQQALEGKPFCQP